MRCCPRGKALEGGGDAGPQKRPKGDRTPAGIATVQPRNRHEVMGGRVGRKVVPVGVHPRFLNSNVKGGSATLSRVEILGHPGNGILESGSVS